MIKKADFLRIGRVLYFFLKKKKKDYRIIIQWFLYSKIVSTSPYQTNSRNSRGCCYILLLIYY